MAFGNFLPTYRQQPKAIKPLRPLPPVPKMGEPLPGQRTMPIAGAPRLPKNPLLDIMRLMRAYRK
jgi:hypothetical protein